MNRCTFCDGAGCPTCRARRGGDQGPTALELELADALAEIAQLRGERDEAQRAAAWAQHERDQVLAQLALLSRGGVA